MQQDEKRNFSRIVMDAPVFLNQGEETWESRLLDISLNGVLLELPENWQPEEDEEYDIEVNLDQSDVQICMQGQIAHVSNNHVGFQCLHIDLDSITELKKLVMLNLGDESVLERELSALAA